MDAAVRHMGKEHPFIHLNVIFLDGNKSQRLILATNTVDMRRSPFGITTEENYLYHNINTMISFRLILPPVERKVEVLVKGITK